MYKIVRTIHSIVLDAVKKRAKTYPLLPNTTLNEKFDVEINKQNESEIDPVLKYFVIGNGNIISFGTNTEEVANINMAYANHKVKDSALYNHVPFIVREVSNDLTLAEQASYRLRVTKTIGSVDYAGYFAKVIPDDGDSVSISTIVKSNTGEISISSFDTNDPELLNPAPSETHGDITADASSYIAVTATDNITLTYDDIVEIKNGIDLWYSEDTVEKRSHFINEIGLCSGGDITTDDGRTESVYTQLCFILETGTEYDLDIKIAENKGISRNIDLGGLEPLAVR